jgi:hypothetical protein
MSDPDPPLLAKPAALQTATKATVPGVLSLSRRRGAWSPNDPTAAQPVSFEYATLTGKAKRLGGGAAPAAEWGERRRVCVCV